MNLFERIADAVYWFLVIFFLFALAILVWTADLLFSKTVDRWMNEFFKPEQKDPIGAYGKFRQDHPVLCWFLQWPLLAVAM